MPLITHITYKLAHGAAAHHVEAVGRLIEDQVAGRVHHGPGQRHLELLAARIALGRPVGELGHAETANQFLGAGLEFGPLHPMEVAVIAKVLARRKPAIKAADVRQDAEPALCFDPVGHRIEAVHRGMTLVGVHQTADDAEGRGLAGAVGAYQPGDLAIRRGQAQTGDRLYLAEGFMKVADFDHCWGLINDLWY